MSSPRVTWLPPQPLTHTSPRFAPHQFHDAGSSLGDATQELAYSDLKHMHIHRVADLTKGRRLPVPSWATSDEQLRSVILKCLENRFSVRNQQGTPSERLDRCRRAAQRVASAKRERLDAYIQQFRALSENKLASLTERNYEQLFCESLAGKGSTARLDALEKQVRILDGETFVTERAPELLAAVLYQYFRLGLNSPSVAENLGLTPWQIRQLIFRARKVAQREGRPTRRKRCTQWLNLKKVSDIRRLAASSVPWDEIARKFGVARETVQNIVNGKTWRGRRRCE